MGDFENKRLTDKKSLKQLQNLRENYKDFVFSTEQLIYEKLGKIEDLMEKYEIKDIKALEELITDYDDMAKALIQYTLGIEVEVKS